MFLVFANVFVNESCPHMERSRKRPYMAILGAAIMLMFRSHERTLPHEKVAFARAEFVKFGESDLEHWYEQTSEIRKSFSVSFGCAPVKMNIALFIYKKTPQITF